MASFFSRTLRSLLVCAAVLAAVWVLPLRSGEAGGSSGLDLTPYRGQVVVVDVWASWCEPCRRSFPWMADLVRRHGERGLVVVAVGVDEDREAARGFLSGTSYPFTFVEDPDGTIAAALRVETMPTSVVFDREGNPAFRHEGFRTEDTATYERNVVALLDGATAVDVGEMAATGRGDGPLLGVRPWERGVLARDDMRLDCDPLDLAIDDHIYFSKEASSGGRGFGGGGCGCN